ncbi:hypothetical protein I4U23_017913 [Adineta vaga]|nr:hypothetical protein I4U23_017913 [Adineta vaga]
MAMINLSITIIFFVVVGRLHAVPLVRDSNGRLRSPEEIGGYFEGDIKIAPSARGVAMRGTYVRWPSGVVPYTISADFTAAQQSVILDAMRTLESSTEVGGVPCIRFREKDATDDYHYIIIEDGVGCSSYVGRMTGSATLRKVTLQSSGCIYKGTIMHELIHALGFFHEQSRPDRDNYVRVIWDTIIPGMQSNFDKYTDAYVDTLYTPYDYQSLMHYGKNFFTINGSDTLVPLDPSATIGQRDNLSPIDIQELQIFYGCIPPLTTASTTDTTTSTSDTSTSITGTTTSTTGTTMSTTSTTTSTTDTTTSTTSTTTSTTDTTTSTTGTNTSHSTTITTTLSSITVTAPMYTSIGSLSLHINRPQYQRPNVSGNYTFTSSSSFPVHSYLYANSFDSSKPLVNLIAQGSNSAGNEKFQFTVFLSTGIQTLKRSIMKRATTTYILISTTQNERTTGLLTMTVLGPYTVALDTEDTLATTTSSPGSNDSNSSSSNTGIIVGSVVGGVVGLLCLCGFCFLIICSWFSCFKGTPFRSNNAYVREGFFKHTDLAAGIFQSNSLSGYLYTDGSWYGPHNLTLGFYPTVDHTVHGKGKDHLGTFVATGVYSPRTLRMAFDKRYQSGLGNVDLIMTIQVEWKPDTQSFEGKYYLKGNNHREEQKYMLHIMNGGQRR